MTRRASSAILALLAFCSPLGAIDIAVTARTSAGLVYGMAREIVLNDAYKLSELDWALQPIFTVGSALEIEAAFGLGVAIWGSIEVASVVPGGTASGLMKDYDYLNDDGEVTHYSQHTSITEDALFLRLRAGSNFSLRQNLSIEPYLELGMMRFKWSARNGYLQYPPELSPPYTPWSPSTPQILTWGTGIAYEQRYFYPALGLALSAVFLSKLDVSASLAFSPFVICNDLDNHFLRQTDFYEFMRGGLLIEPGLEIGLRIAERARLELGASYRKIWSLLGDAYMESTGIGVERTVTRFTDGGAAEYEALAVSLSFGLSL